MNTINSASNSASVKETPAGEPVAETSDPSALEQLKALLDKPSGFDGGSDDGLSDDDQGSGPDWSLMDGLVPVLANPMTTGGPAAADGAVSSQSGPAVTSNPAAWGSATVPGASSATLSAGELAAQAFSSLVKAIQGDTAPMPNLEGNTGAAQGDTLGSAILDSFFSQSSGLTQGASAAIPAGPADASNPVADRVAKIENLMNTMLDRVLVSDPLVGQNQEVRIKFQDAILPGTEARVWREDGRIMVEFVSTKAESIRWLEGSVAMLSQRLDEKIFHTAPSVVTVNSSGESPSDGRSRERDTPWDQARQQQQQQQEDATA